MDRLHPKLDEDGKPYINCECGARRYIREAPITECSKCGARYIFKMKQLTPPIPVKDEDG